MCVKFPVRFFNTKLMSLKIKILIASIFILVNIDYLEAQVNKDNLRFGQEAFDNGDYFSAAYYYEKALENDKENFDLAYWLAEASRLSYAYKDAEKWYLFVQEKSDKKYPLIKFHLGSVYKSLGQYDDALRYYNEFAEAAKDPNKTQLEKAQQEIKSCHAAKLLLNDSVKAIINRLDNVINTPYTEFNPYPLSDSVLYFSSLRPTGVDKPKALIKPSYTTAIYKSIISMSGFSEPKEIDSKINTGDCNNANITFNQDKTTMYFSRCKEEGKPLKMNCNIYRSILNNNRWSIPEKLSNEINMPGYTSTQPAFGKNKEQQEALYFVSDRPGGQGGLDLWCSVMKNGVFHTPINMGSFINTAGNEIAPFFHLSSQTLYYSSDWTEGLGGYDIFSSKGFFSEWQKPVNAGYPINTSYNDMYFVMNESYPEAYFSSNRPGSLHLKGETCCNDIYFVKFREAAKDTTPEIVVITDSVPPTPKSQIAQLLPLTLYFHNDEPDPATTKAYTDKTYETTLQSYTLLKDIYLKEYSEGLTGNEKLKAQNDIREFFDSYVMNGFEKLQKFASWLKEDLDSGNTVQITIRGYCSPLNRGEYNVNLSKRRISSLLNYIRTYDNGRFIPYLEKTAPNGGTLDIFEEPLGDAQSAPFVSNNPNDVRNSVYSRAAALERKVEIVMYNSGRDSADFSFPEITFRNTSQDFGNLKKGDRKPYMFLFKNTGKSNLLVTSVETTTSAIVTDWEAKEIMPGGTGAINILLDTKNLSGAINEKVYITANTNQGKIMLEVKAKIE